MAIKITDNQGLYCEAAVAESMPFSVVMWFRVKTATSNHPLFWIGDKDDADIWCDLEARGGQSGDPVRLVQKWTVVNYRKAEVQPYAAETWHHVVGVWASTTSRLVYLDGSPGTENTDESVALSGYDRTALGAQLDSSPSFEDWQELAEVGVWNRVVTEAEAVAMAGGASPFHFFEDMVAYWPFGRRYGQDYRDLVGSYDLSEWDDSALEWVDHPPGIVYPVGPFEKAYHMDFFAESWR